MGSSTNAILKEQVLLINEVEEYPFTVVKKKVLDATSSDIVIDDDEDYDVDIEM